MRSLFFTIFVVMLSSVLPAQPAPKPKKISAGGCVEQGVEAGCLIVRSAKDDKIYNVLFQDGKKPDVGSGISFEGVQHDGPTACMQGTAVEVKQWRPVATECSKHGTPKLKK